MSEPTQSEVDRAFAGFLQFHAVHMAHVDRRKLLHGLCDRMDSRGEERRQLHRHLAVGGSTAALGAAATWPKPTKGFLVDTYQRQRRSRHSKHNSSNNNSDRGVYAPRLEPAEWREMLRDFYGYRLSIYLTGRKHASAANFLSSLADGEQTNRRTALNDHWKASNLQQCLDRKLDAIDDEVVACLENFHRQLMRKAEGREGKKRRRNGVKVDQHQPKRNGSENGGADNDDDEEEEEGSRCSSSNSARPFDHRADSRREDYSGSSERKRHRSASPPRETAGTDGVGGGGDSKGAGARANSLGTGRAAEAAAAAAAAAGETSSGGDRGGEDDDDDVEEEEEPQRGAGDSGQKRKSAFAGSARAPYAPRLSPGQWADMLRGFYGYRLACKRMTGKKRASALRFLAGSGELTCRRTLLNEHWRYSNLQLCLDGNLEGTHAEVSACIRKYERQLGETVERKKARLEYLPSTTAS